jgi:dihydrolipoamide dehydrogenase|tara:strand:+ start:1482 stop:2906 length:1425 start_codon:yes stop_codon:yes gene_type:complete
MTKYDYNIIVIGGGSAGLVSSYIASAVKAKVALIEKHKMGGDCLNTGCVPSKALLRSAKMISYAKRAKEFGFKKTTVDFDFKDVMNRVQNIIKIIEPHDSRKRYTALGVECIEGEAKILSPHNVEVNGITLTARSIIIATGAKPLIPNIPGIDQINYLTSDNVWDLKELPKKLLVLGGGPIGVEMAQAFSRLGAEVTIVEMTPQILIREDEEVIELVTERFVKEGIKVLINHKAKEFKHNLLICEHKSKDVSIPFDKVIIALGRQANIEGFGLEELGVKIRETKTIEANAFLQTNIKSIYVCGDVTGPYQFTHTAAHQAWYACVNALFSPLKKFKVDYTVIPWATFTDPEVARVGLNEKDAKIQNILYEVTTYDIDDLDRAIADSEAHGFIKVLTVPNKDKILGVTIVGRHAGDLIAEYILAMKYGLGMNKILATIHIYPTLSEANKYVAGNWKKEHLPTFAIKILERFHKWRR